jgi:serine protein kinase
MHDIMKDLGPMEKLELYNTGQVPTRISQQQAQELKSQLKNLYYDHYYSTNYEGRYGASPREVRMIILNAALDPRFDYVSVGAIFDQIELLIEQKSTFEFLRREPERGYRDPAFLLALVKRSYLSILEDEVRTAMGIYRRESYVDLFTRYILHVSAWTKKERLIDPLLQRKVDADEQFMASIETSLLAEKEARVDFRQQLIAQVGAFMLENPQGTLDYQTLFAGHIRRLKESVYREQKNMVHRVIQNFLVLNQPEKSKIDEREMKNAMALQAGLLRLGYIDPSARWAMSYLLQAEEHPKKDEQLGLKIDT